MDGAGFGEPASIGPRLETVDWWRGGPGPGRRLRASIGPRLETVDWVDVATHKVRRIEIGASIGPRLETVDWAYTHPIHPGGSTPGFNWATA